MSRHRRTDHDPDSRSHAMTPQGPPRVARVTHVVFDLDSGGLESLVGSLVRRFERSDVVSSIVTLSGRIGRVGESVREHVDRFAVVPPNATGPMVRPRGLANVIRATTPDVVHLHSGAWLKGARAARMAGVQRVVYTEHGLPERDHWLGPTLCRLAARQTDTIVAVSDVLARRLEALLHLEPGRVRTVRNGVDTLRFTPAAADERLRDSLDLPPGAKVLGSVGRFEPVKALDRLVRAFADIRNKVSSRPLILVLFGEGTEQRALIALARELGVFDAIRLPGWISDPLDAYHLLDAFALTSRSEGVPLSLLEAMAAGVPPVVTDVGANREILGPDLAPFVVASGNHAALTRALVDVLNRDRDTLSATARERIRNAFDLRLTVDGYRKIYHGTNG